MTECNITASTPVLVAIDISQGRHEVLIEVPDKKRHLRVSVLNTLDEFERLINLLRSFSAPYASLLKQQKTIIADWRFSLVQQVSISS
jgi:hypothetical protein